jgi:hypothetical protein
MVFDLVDRGHVEGWTLGLLAFAALPWFWQVIESIGFPGGSLRFRRLEDAQQRQALDIETLQFLIANFLTPAEQTHLKKLAAGEKFPVFSDAPNAFYDEFHHLRALDFIRGLPGKGLRSMRNDRGDVRNHFEITELGRKYLALTSETDPREARPANAAGT